MPPDKKRSDSSRETSKKKEEEEELSKVSSNSVSYPVGLVMEPKLAPIYNLGAPVAPFNRLQVRPSSIYVEPQGRE